MSFYILSQYLTDGSATINRAPQGLEPSDFLKGKWIEENSLPSIVRPSLDRIFDMHPQSGDGRGDIMDGIVTLFHDDFIDVLGEFGELPCQFFKCGIRDVKTGELEGGYNIVNPLVRVNALDMDKSQYDLNSQGKPWFIETFHIIESETQGAPIFRLDEFPTKLIINQELSNYLLTKLDLDIISGVHLLETQYHMYEPSGAG